MDFYKQRFKEFREKAGFTLEEVGKKLKISKQSIEQWESGKSKPKPCRIPEIAKMLSCKQSDISSLNEKPDSSIETVFQETIMKNMGSRLGFEKSKFMDEEELKIWNSLKDKSFSYELSNFIEKRKDFIINTPEKSYVSKLYVIGINDDLLKSIDLLRKENMQISRMLSDYDCERIYIARNLERDTLADIISELFIYLPLYLQEYLTNDTLMGIFQCDEWEKFREELISFLPDRWIHSIKFITLKKYEKLLRQYSDNNLTANLMDIWQQLSKANQYRVLAMIEDNFLKDIKKATDSKVG